MRETEAPLQLIKSCGPVEAQMIEEFLEKNGIECTLQGEASANALPVTGDLDEVRVWVKREDVLRAAQLVDAFFTPVNKEDLVDKAAELGVE